MLIEKLLTPNRKLQRGYILINKTMSQQKKNVTLRETQLDWYSSSIYFDPRGLYLGFFSGSYEVIIFSDQSII